MIKLIKSAKLVGATFVFFIFSFNGVAQVPSFDSTMVYLNKQLAGKAKIEVVRGKLKAIYFEKRVEVREDKVLISDLDPESSGFEKEKKMFYVPCFGTEGTCVYRKLYVTGIFREYSRISFVLDGDENQVANFKKAFTHMVKMVNDSDYKANISFEK